MIIYIYIQKFQIKTTTWLQKNPLSINNEIRLFVEKFFGNWSDMMKTQLYKKVILVT